MNPDLVTVDAIEKRFHQRTVVDRLSFCVRRNEIFALLGPNGAGKTTTIRMLLSIIKPDAGAIRFSLDGGAAPDPSRLGYLPEDRGLYKEIPVLKTLTYMGVLRGLRRGEAAGRARAWLERVGLGDRMHEKLDALSKGNQQKVQFVSSILHAPAFAILDEPFSGLDPLNQELFLAVIRDLCAQGMTILLCAHQMELVERIADRVLLMDRGREVLSGTLPEIRERATAVSKVVVSLAAGADLSALRASPLLERLDELAAGELACYLKKGVSLQEFLRHVTASFEVTDIRTARVNLHEIFVQTVGRSDPSDQPEARP